MAQTKNVWDDDTLDGDFDSDNVAKPLETLGNWLKVQATWLFSTWLFTSKLFPSTLQLYTKIHYSDPFSEDTEIVDEFTTKSTFEKLMSRAMTPIDGVDLLSDTLTCADGTVKSNISQRQIPWQIQLVALMGLPSRPRTIDKGTRNPQFVSGWELFLDVLSNMCGGLPFPKETISGQRTVKKEDVSMEESETPEIVTEPHSLYQYRWTEKRRLLLILSIIRIPLFFIFNLAIWPFKLVRNLLRLATEVLLAAVSYYLARLNMKCIDFFIWSLRAYMNSRPLKKLLGLVLWLPIVVLPALAISVVLGVVQYASIWACRIGMAFSSPIKSAVAAWQAGLAFHKVEHFTKVKLWRIVISFILASLGVALSAALSIATWSIVLPLVLSALVAAVPALLTPISWATQAPFIGNFLSWFTQLPLVIGATTAVQTAFGIVGTALATTFGPAIASLGTLVAVTIPEVLMVFALSISFIVMPVISAITIGVEKLSDRFTQWVEQRPFHRLINWLKSFKSPSPEKSGEPKIDLDKRNYYDLHSIVVYQAKPGKEYVLHGVSAPEGLSKKPRVEIYQLKVDSEKLEDAAKKAEKIADAIVITDLMQMKKIWNRAKKNIDHSSTQKARFLTAEEINNKVLLNT